MLWKELERLQMPHSEEVGRLWSQIQKRIQKRIHANRHALAKLGLARFYVAGGALMPPVPNDYDLFPVGKNDFDHFFKNERGERESQLNTKVWETPNAITYIIDEVKIQLCKFWNESLIKTVERFDFTHCKLGAEVRRVEKKGAPIFEVTDVYISEDFIRYRILGYSEYTGVQMCDYPLSSLLRVFKYIKKGYIRSSYDVIFKILEALLERGYTSEEDFKRQLQGIDVGVEEAEQLDANSESLKHIYFLLTGNTITDDKMFERDMMIGDGYIW